MDKIDTKAAPVAEGDLKLPLRKPIQAHGQELKELVFREPNGGDINVCGDPVNIDWNVGPNEAPKISYNAPSMSAMMSRLAAVPPSSITQLHPRDWKTGAVLLSPFFIPDLG